MITHSQTFASEFAVYVLLAGIGVLVVLMLFAAWPWLCTRFIAVHGHKTAEQRADRLLHQHLSTAQYRQLSACGYLLVPSRLYPGHSYRIPRRPGRTQIYAASGTGVASRKIGELCIVTEDWMPHADLILAQKWLIEADEQAYLSTANWMSGISLYYGW
jgi:hypothetical protein